MIANFWEKIWYGDGGQWSRRGERELRRDSGSTQGVDGERPVRVREKILVTGRVICDEPHGEVFRGENKRRGSTESCAEAEHGGLQ